MSELTTLSNPPSAISDVVFVHGLGGDAVSTWKASDADASWPQMLAEDQPNVAVHSLQYDAALSDWLGDSMPLADRANDVLDELDSRGIGSRPVVFICHSMGGLVVKQLLRSAYSLSDGHPWKEISNAVEKIVFLATPHGGSDSANYINGLSKVLPKSGSIVVAELKKNNVMLRDLNSWFRNSFEKLDLSIKVYFEGKDTAGFRIVDEGSGDPGISGVIAVRVDVNHKEISKPSSKVSLIYGRVIRFISVNSSEDNFDEDVEVDLGAPTITATKVEGDDSHWDFFIAHAGPDKDHAEKIYDLMEGKARIFLDSRSLVLGDDWDVKIAEAQRSSRVTVVLISEKTDESYYQREEIAAAIDLARANGGHRVVPVYLTSKAASSKSVPYGLRLKHGITLSNKVGIAVAADALLNLPAFISSESVPSAGTSPSNGDVVETTQQKNANSEEIENRFRADVKAAVTALLESRGSTHLKSALKDAKVTVDELLDRGPSDSIGSVLKAVIPLENRNDISDKELTASLDLGLELAGWLAITAVDAEWAASVITDDSRDVMVEVEFEVSDRMEAHLVTRRLLCKSATFRFEKTGDDRRFEPDAGAVVQMGYDDVERGANHQDQFNALFKDVYFQILQQKLDRAPQEEDFNEVNRYVKLRPDKKYHLLLSLQNKKYDETCRKCLKAIRELVPALPTLIVQFKDSSTQVILKKGEVTAALRAIYDFVEEVKGKIS